MARDFPLNPDICAPAERDRSARAPAIGIDRRRLIAAAGAAVLFPAAPAAAVTRPESRLHRAMDRLGDRHLLERVRLLSWQGEAVVHDGGRSTPIGVSTMVVPFVAARSANWPLALGPAATRTLIVDTGGARIEGGGTAEHLPELMARHQLAQFAIYGMMLLAPLDRGRASLRIVHDRSDFDLLRVHHGQAPVTRLYFESDGRLAEASNSVPHPEQRGESLSQRYFFSEEQMPGPVRWPRTLRIEQEGRPYFELTLSRFEAST